MTAYLSELALRILEHSTYFGVFFLMMLESMVAPVPSEAVMPFAGFLVADGRWHFGLVLLAASLGSFCGSFLSYLLGYYGGKPLVLKLGRYLLLNPHDLELTERYFQKKSGALTVFIARFIPVIRHLISIPAGTGKMPLASFLFLSTLGATLWNAFLLTCGVLLRSRWEVVQRYSHRIDFVVVASCVLAALFFLTRRWRTCRKNAGKNER